MEPLLENLIARAKKTNANLWCI